MHNSMMEAGIGTGYCPQGQGLKQVRCKRNDWMKERNVARVFGPRQNLVTYRRIEDYEVPE